MALIAPKIVSVAALVALPVASSEPRDLYGEVVAARRCEGARCIFDLEDLSFTITFPGEQAELGVSKKAEAATFRRFAYSVFTHCILITGTKGGPPLTRGRQVHGEVPEVFVSTRNAEVYRSISECERGRPK
jgi:hypothetical protein